MDNIYKTVRMKLDPWERLRNLSYANRMSIPAFIKVLVDNFEKGLK